MKNRCCLFEVACPLFDFLYATFAVWWGLFEIPEVYLTFGMPHLQFGGLYLKCGGVYLMFGERLQYERVTLVA